MIKPEHYDVKLRAIPFTTMKKSFQALKIEFDWPIPNSLGHDFTQSLHSSVFIWVRKWKYKDNFLTYFFYCWYQDLTLQQYIMNFVLQANLSLAWILSYLQSISFQDMFLLFYMLSPEGILEVHLKCLVSPHVP